MALNNQNTISQLYGHVLDPKCWNDVSDVKYDMMGRFDNILEIIGDWYTCCFLERYLL